MRLCTNIFMNGTRYNVNYMLIDCEFKVDTMRQRCRLHGKCMEWDEIVHHKFDEIVKLDW